MHSSKNFCVPSFKAIATHWGSTSLLFSLAHSRIGVSETELLSDEL